MFIDMVKYYTLISVSKRELKCVEGQLVNSKAVYSTFKKHISV